MAHRFGITSPRLATIGLDTASEASTFLVGATDTPSYTYPPRSFGVKNCMQVFPVGFSGDREQISISLSQVGQFYMGKWATLLVREIQETLSLRNLDRPLFSFDQLSTPQPHVRKGRENRCKWKLYINSISGPILAIVSLFFQLYHVVLLASGGLVHWIASTCSMTSSRQGKEIIINQHMPGTKQQRADRHHRPNRQNTTMDIQKVGYLPHGNSNNRRKPAILGGRVYAYIHIVTIYDRYMFQYD